ncbi:hypothetical protein ACQKH8_10275, partial [Staphylococcus aureus]
TVANPFITTPSAGIVSPFSTRIFCPAFNSVALVASLGVVSILLFVAVSVAVTLYFISVGYCCLTRWYLQLVT